MSVSEIILLITGILSALTGTGYFAFVFARSKYKQEVEKLKVEVLQAQKAAETTDIENGTKVVLLYKDALDDLGDRYEKKFQDLANLYDQKEKHLLKEIEIHQKQASLYERMYNDKVKEFNKYKREYK